MVRWEFNPRIIKRKKNPANSVWATVVYPCRPFHFIYQKLLGPHFSTSHNGIVNFFLLITREGVTSVDNSGKASLSNSPLFIFAQGSLRWRATGLSKVTSGGGAPGMRRMCILWMLGQGGCSLLGFYPFSLVWLLP